MARSNEAAAARAIVERWREMLRPSIVEHRDTSRYSSAQLSSTIARGPLLREEAYELEARSTLEVSSASACAISMLAMVAFVQQLPPGTIVRLTLRAHEAGRERN